MMNFWHKEHKIINIKNTFWIIGEHKGAHWNLLFYRQISSQIRWLVWKRWNERSQVCSSARVTRQWYWNNWLQKKCEVSYLASRHGEIEVANTNWRTSDVIPKEPWWIIQMESRSGIQRNHLRRHTWVVDSIFQIKVWKGHTLQFQESLSV